MPWVEIPINKGLDSYHYAEDVPDGYLNEANEVIYMNGGYVHVCRNATAILSVSSLICGMYQFDQYSTTGGTFGAGYDYYSYLAPTLHYFDITNNTAVDITGAKESLTYNATDYWSFVEYGKWLLTTGFDEIDADGVYGSTYVRVCKKPYAFDITSSGGGTGGSISLTASTYVTVTCPTAHSLSTGNTVSLWGMFPSYYNVSNVTISVRNSTVFEFTLPAPQTLQPTPSPTARYMKTYEKLAGLSNIKASHMVFKNGHLVLGATEESGVAYQKRLRWSALENLESWTSSITTGADYQDIADADGPIIGLGHIGNNIAIIHDNAISVATYTGYPYTFTIRANVAKNVPRIIKGTYIELNNIGYFMTEQGVCIFDGQGYKLIHRMSSSTNFGGVVHLKEYNTIMWMGYPGNCPEMAYYYNYVDDVFSECNGERFYQGCGYAAVPYKFGKTYDTPYIFAANRYQNFVDPISTLFYAKTHTLTSASETVTTMLKTKAIYANEGVLQCTGVKVLGGYETTATSKLRVSVNGVRASQNGADPQRWDVVVTGKNIQVAIEQSRLNGASDTTPIRRIFAKLDTIAEN